MSKKIHAIKWVFISLFVITLTACQDESSQPEEKKVENTTLIESRKIENLVEAPREKITTKTPVTNGMTPIRVDRMRKIESMHKELMKQMDTGFDTEQVVAYAKETEMYMSIYGDSLAAEHAFNAGELYRAIGDFDSAMNLWYVVYSNFENRHPKAPHALFQCGFTHENITGNKDAAKMLYNRFIKKYPNHDLIDQTSKLLSNLEKSKSDLDLIKEFQKRGQSQ